MTDAEKMFSPTHAVVGSCWILEQTLTRRLPGEMHPTRMDLCRPGLMKMRTSDLSPMHTDLTKDSQLLGSCDLMTLMGKSRNRQIDLMMRPRVLLGMTLYDWLIFGCPE